MPHEDELLKQKRRWTIKELTEKSRIDDWGGKWLVRSG